jgi:hypothetical protein
MLIHLLPVETGRAGRPLSKDSRGRNLDEGGWSLSKSNSANLLPLNQHSFRFVTLGQCTEPVAFAQPINHLQQNERIFQLHLLYLPDDRPGLVQRDCSRRAASAATTSLRRRRWRNVRGVAVAVRAVRPPSYSHCDRLIPKRCFKKCYYPVKIAA